jgi:2-amino-4-hydroxy-6-hydroxymethyldihydropteridine diphosphokinase
METVYIGIGSNLGDKQQTCEEAILRLDTLPDSKIAAKADFFRTEPIGEDGQDWYVNSVVCLATALEARELLNHLLAIEAGMGRKRVKKWDSRIIDLDILLYGCRVMEEEGLTIPHPHMHLRRFVMVPMVQLAPEMIHPVLGKTMQHLLHEIPAEGQGVYPMEGR